MAATMETDNGDVWRELDSKFFQLKVEEDQLRALYALPSNHPDRPDRADPTHQLIELNDQELSKLQKSAEQARAQNCRDINVQVQTGLRSCNQLVADCAYEADGNTIDEIFAGMPSELSDYLCLAGGALFDLLFLHKLPQDWDFFVVGTSQPTTILRMLLQHFEPDRITRTVNAVTFATRSKLSQSNTKKQRLLLQLILRSYVSPSEVLTGFDIDASGLCYYRGKIYATARAIYAIGRMMLNIDIDRMSTSYSYRLAKYMNKKLFSLYIPVTITLEHFSMASIHQREIIYCKNINDNYNDSLIGLLVMIYYVNEARMGKQKYQHINVSDYSDPALDNSDISDSSVSNYAPLNEDIEFPENVDMLSPKNFSQLSLQEQLDITYPFGVYSNTPEATEYNNFIYMGFNKRLAIYYSNYLKNHGMVYAHYDTCCKKIINLVFDNARTGKRSYAKPNIEYVLHYPGLQCLPYILAWLFNSDEYLRPINSAVPAKVEFKTQNPGTQFTGSFQPIDINWDKWCRKIELPKPYNVPITMFQFK